MMPLISTVAMNINLLSDFGKSQDKGYLLSNSHRKWSLIFNPKTLKARMDLALIWSISLVMNQRKLAMRKTN